VWFTSHTHTHTHTFNGPLSGTTRVSRYQKDKTNLDFTEARDSKWQWNPLGHMQVCTSLQTDNHASTPPLSCLQTECPSCRPSNSVKALKAKSRHTLSCKLVGVFAMIFAVLLQNQAQGSVALYHFQSLPSDLAVVALHCGGPSLWLTTIVDSQQLAF